MSIFGVILVRIQSDCGKIRTRITPNTDTFYAVPTLVFFFHLQQTRYIKGVYYDHQNVFGFMCFKIEIHFDIYKAKYVRLYSKDFSVIFSDFIFCRWKFCYRSKLKTLIPRNVSFSYMKKSKSVVIRIVSFH